MRESRASDYTFLQVLLAFCQADRSVTSMRETRRRMDLPGCGAFEQERLGEEQNERWVCLYGMIQCWFSSQRGTWTGVVQAGGACGYTAADDEETSEYRIGWGVEERRGWWSIN